MFSTTSETTIVIELNNRKQNDIIVVDNYY